MLIKQSFFKDPIVNLLEGRKMKMLVELFGSFAGQLSLAVILFMIGMVIFFARLFIKKSAEGGDQ